MEIHRRYLPSSPSSSYDSNDTPTACNGQHQNQDHDQDQNENHSFDGDDKEIFLSTPPNNHIKWPRHQHQEQRMRRRRRRNCDGKITKEELYNSLPPKTIMQRSLSLGDSLSPNEGGDEEEREEEDDLGGITDHNHHISINEQQHHGDSPRIGENGAYYLHSTDKESLQLPTIASPLRVRGKTEEKKMSTDVKPSSSPRRSKNDDARGRRQSQFQQKPMYGDMDCNAKKRITRHPFFWRSHPHVTVKSYHFQQQQHRPRVRRIVPKMARVPSVNDASSFISSCRKSPINQDESSSSNSAAACRFDGADDSEAGCSSHQDETTGIPNDERQKLRPIVDGGGEAGSSSDGHHYSPYIHPAVVRRMWMESQSVSSSSPSFLKQGRHCPESSAGPLFAESSSSATASALDFLGSIKKSLRGAIQL